MQGARLGRERLLALMVGDAQPVLLDLLDMLGPRIDEGDVFAGLRHMRPGVAADRPGADDDDPFAHGFLPASAVESIVDPGDIAEQCAGLRKRWQSCDARSAVAAAPWRALSEARRD